MIYKTDGMYEAHKKLGGGRGEVFDIGDGLMCSPEAEGFTIEFKLLGVTSARLAAQKST